VLKWAADYTVLLHPVAHWNDERDRKRVLMMRGCNVPDSEEVITFYEQQGDDAYWYQFIELMRADAVNRRRAALPGVPRRANDL
jgi:hypothetical protein